jgi:thiol-disulfide isomerase/thioredoxin
MKKILKEVVIFAVLLFVITTAVSYWRAPKLDSEQLPELDVTLLDGSRFTPTPDQPLLIHFWGSWCPVCTVEAGNIQRVSTRYPTLTFAVNSGSDKEVQTYMNDGDHTFAVVNDTDGTWAKKFHVTAFPTTFIYDATGIRKFTEVGYTTTAGLLGRLALAK